MSDETESIPAGYKRDADGMLVQITGTGSDQTPQNPALSEAEIAKLQELSREGLIDLFKRLPAKITGYALQTREERREAMRLKIYDIAMSADNDTITLKAANDWLDRDEGKAINRTAIDARVTLTGGVCPTCGSDPSLSFSTILDSLEGPTVAHILSDE